MDGSGAVLPVQRRRVTGAVANAARPRAVSPKASANDQRCGVVHVSAVRVKRLKRLAYDVLPKLFGKKEELATSLSFQYIPPSPARTRKGNAGSYLSIFLCAGLLPDATIALTLICRR